MLRTVARAIEATGVVPSNVAFNSSGGAWVNLHRAVDAGGVAALAAALGLGETTESEVLARADGTQFYSVATGDYIRRGEFQVKAFIDVPPAVQS